MDQWSSVTETPTYIQSVSSARPSCRSPFPYSTTAIIPAPTQHPSLASMYLSPSYAIMHHFTRSEDSDHQPRYDHLGSTRPAQIRMDSYSAQQDCQSKQVSQMVDYQPMHALHYPSSEDQSPHGGQYSGQMYNNRHTTIQSSAADASYMFQPKHAPTYESTVVEESSVHMESRRSKYEEATNYVAIPKRNMSALVEDERNQTEPNMKRIKITNADAEGAEHPLDPEDIETTGLLMSLAISRTMPLPDVVALLLQHGCQDITEMINLRTCSEYPLSFGGFGDIFRGELNDGASVAIKCVKIVIDSSSSEHEKYLKCAAREIYAWSKLDHRYVSKLLGLAQFRGQIAMVSPWAEHGALPWFLTRRPQHNRPRLVGGNSLYFVRSFVIDSLPG
ncbi:hypothetical protein FRC09_019549 [Ceratobasidium sp. 395]|nr:hypothetical protein FRC09_019549 [Ceratobasidium sp. 395]